MTCMYDEVNFQFRISSNVPGLPGNATYNDYSFTTTGGMINSSYSECNVDTITGQWYYTIIKRGTSTRNYYSFVITTGQPGNALPLSIFTI
jgi:hypothetical protein